MLAPNILESGSKFPSIAFLVLEQSKTVANEVTLKRAARREYEINESHCRVTSNAGLRDRSYGSVCTEDREVVSDQSNIGNRRGRDHIVLLEVKTERKFADHVLHKVRVEAEGIVMTAR